MKEIETFEGILENIDGETLLQELLMKIPHLIPKLRLVFPQQNQRDSSLPACQGASASRHLQPYRKIGRLKACPRRIQKVR